MVVVVFCFYFLWVGFFVFGFWVFLQLSFLKSFLTPGFYLLLLVCLVLAARIPAQICSFYLLRAGKNQIIKFITTVSKIKISGSEKELGLLPSHP